MIKLGTKSYVKLIILIRLIGILIPQIGYIHPDEFFQGPEIAGESLGYDVFKAWEYKGSSPIRSAVFPLLISKTAFLPLKLATDAQGVTIPPCLLLALPRLLMFLFSLVQDYCLLKMCNHLNLDPTPVVLIYGSSFVSFVFMIRTFSNCLESCLFTILLSLTVSAQIKPTSNFHTLLLGFLVAVGVFVRPTFMLFAVVPVFFWCFSKYPTSSSACFFKILKMAVVTLVTVLGLIWLDTHYFHRHSGQLTVNDIIVTPLNFLRYNSQTTNLEKHGLHPRYLHFAVNLPLMYNILALFAVFENVRRLPSFSELPTTDIILALSWVLPMAGLSLVPHQEPRFLLPFLVPLVLAHSESVYHNKIYRIIWLVGNVLCALVVGSFHQGGLVQFLLESNHFRSPHTHTTLFFSHTYMVPLHMLQTKVGERTLDVYDLRDAPVEPIPGRYCKEHCLIIMPGSVAYSNKSLEGWRRQGKRMELVRSYFPHLSMEVPPDLSKICSIFNETCSTWRTLLFQLSLHVYEIT